MTDARTTTDGYSQIPPDSTGAKIDTGVVTRDDGTLETTEDVTRQRVQLAGAANEEVAAVRRDVLPEDYGVVVRATQLDAIAGSLAELVKEQRKTNELLLTLVHAFDD